MQNETLLTRCLDGDIDARREVFYDGDLEFINAFLARATTEEQFAFLATGPVGSWWVNAHDFNALREASPILVNLVVAHERRSTRAAEVMTLLAAIDDRRPAPDLPGYTPKPELASLIRPGAHSMTESLLVPSLESLLHEPTPPASMSDDEIAGIADRYVRKEDDDYWEELHRITRESPRDAWRVILAILERANEIDMGYFGAGAVEQLVSDHGEARASELHDAIENNPAFVRALAGAYLFSLSERLLLDLAATCRRVLAR